MKKASALLLAALLSVSVISACKPETRQESSQQSPAISDQSTPEDDGRIIEAFYTNFLKLAEIPRPSHHEEKISQFFFEWAKEKGYSPVKDKNMNVMFDVPATSGKEGLPLVSLQVHMDMVAVGEDGSEYDPLNDPIRVIRDDESGTITADGTSLGADDGAGAAMIMTLLESGDEHGPLRMIITSNEEDGMTGTLNMDPEWVSAPKYMINIDSEDSNGLIVSTASGDVFSGAKETKAAAPKGNTALSVRISGLKGGHSGIEIDKGRCNGIIALASFLKELSEQNIAFELASLEGGSAPNAIPDSAACVIVTDKGSKETIASLAKSYLAKLNEAYKDIEDNIGFTVSETDMPSSVVSADNKDDALRLITNIVNGVRTMSPDKEGLVESSSNLGLFSLNDKGSSFTANVRSSVAEKRTELLDSHTSLAKDCGYTFETQKTADPWPYDPDNKLMDIAARVYKEQNGAEPEIIALHAGLECGSYAVYNPDLMMISIGPEIRDVHSPQETLTLSSVPKTYKLLKGILLSVE